MLAVQSDAPALQKDSINPHFGNRYLSLQALMEQVLPLLNRNGIVLVQSPTVEDGSPALTTELRHVATNDAVQATMLLSLDKSTPQGQGSAITYARRYALMSMLGLVADEDDDGNTATGRAPKKAPKQSDIKREVWAIAKAKLDKDRPTVAEVAKLFEVKQGELSDKATLERILEEQAD